ncbi:MAG: hypothetical protein ACXWB9_11020 [Flavisolibacter sp.]
MILIIFLAAATSCNDSEPTGPVAPHQPGIQNVNGNIPDTSGSINLGGSQTIDSSRVKDSL